MKSILKGFIYVIFFIAMLVAFLPKENLYFLAIDKLKQNKIDLVQNNINSDLFSLQLDKLKIYYENIAVSDISSIDLDLFLYQTNININKIVVDDSFKKFTPSKIDYININHSILNPLHITIDVKFKQGKAIGDIDLLNNKINLELKVSKRFKTEYRYLVKQLKYQKERSTSKEEVYSFEYKY